MATVDKLQIGSEIRDIAVLWANVKNKPDLSSKQDKITDLDLIRANATLGATALQEETYKGTVTSVNGVEPIDGNVTIDIPEIPEIPTLITEDTVSSWGFSKTKASSTSDGLMSKEDKEFLDTYFSKIELDITDYKDTFGTTNSIETSKINSLLTKLSNCCSSGTKQVFVKFSDVLSLGVLKKEDGINTWTLQFFSETIHYNLKFIFNNGTLEIIDNSVGLTEVTSTKSGLMTSTDKIKLDSLYVNESGTISTNDTTGLFTLDNSQLNGNDTIN